MDFRAFSDITLSAMARDAEERLLLLAHYSEVMSNNPHKYTEEQNKMLSSEKELAHQTAEAIYEELQLRENLSRRQWL